MEKSKRGKMQSLLLTLILMVSHPLGQLWLPSQLKRKW